jgi:hypothetical protein
MASIFSASLKYYIKRDNRYGAKPNWNAWYQRRICSSCGRWGVNGKRNGQSKREYEILKKWNMCETLKLIIVMNEMACWYYHASNSRAANGRNSKALLSSGSNRRKHSRSFDIGSNEIVGQYVHGVFEMTMLQRFTERYGAAETNLSISLWAQTKWSNSTRRVAIPWSSTNYEMTAPAMTFDPYRNMNRRNSLNGERLLG